MSEKRGIPKHVPLCFQQWMKMGFEWVEVLDGYIRIATTEYDKPGTIVILLDGFGAVRAYHIGEEGEEYAVEFTAEMGKALYDTWRWANVGFLKHNN